MPSIPPQLKPAQTKILEALAEGAEIGAYHNRVTLQHNGLGRGGETEAVTQKDLSFLRDQKLIGQVGQDHLATRYQITARGKDLLEGKWEDLRGDKNDDILNSEPQPEPEEAYHKAERGTHQENEEVTTHPSYGTIGIFHTSGETNLFGATVPHSHFISLRINGASLRRSLHSDTHFSNEEYIEVRLSYDQFVSFLFSSNQGSGVPCTIARRNGECIEKPPKPVSKRQQFSEEFKHSLGALNADACSLSVEAQELLKRPGGLKANEKDRLLQLVTRLTRDVKSNLPFVEKQFQEQLDKSEAEANSSLQGRLQQTIADLGLEGLRNTINTPALQVGYDVNAEDVVKDSAEDTTD
jgi:hypothetical protein